MAARTVLLHSSVTATGRTAANLRPTGKGQPTSTSDTLSLCLHWSAAQHAVCAGAHSGDSDRVRGRLPDAGCVCGTAGSASVPVVAAGGADSPGGASCWSAWPRSPACDTRRQQPCACGSAACLIYLQVSRVPRDTRPRCARAAGRYTFACQDRVRVRCCTWHAGVGLWFDAHLACRGARRGCAPRRGPPVSRGGGRGAGPGDVQHRA